MCFISLPSMEIQSTLLSFTTFQVPNLFAVDEKQEICEKMHVLDRQRDRDKQTDGSPLSLFNMFIERCRTQLHVVMAMSPIGDAFRNRLRSFPALINCCTINWFQVCVCVCVYMLRCCWSHQNDPAGSQSKDRDGIIEKEYYCFIKKGLNMPIVRQIFV